VRCKTEQQILFQVGKPDPAVKERREAERPKEKRGEAERHMRELAGVFTDPLIVHRSPWMDTLPGWLKDQVTTERLIALMQANRGQGPLTGTDAEALAYLYPASLEAPFDYDWSEIYLYLATKVCTASGGPGGPGGCQGGETLRLAGVHCFGDLKGWIYRKRKGTAEGTADGGRRGGDGEASRRDRRERGGTGGRADRGEEGAAGNAGPGRIVRGPFDRQPLERLKP
jgi:hypothetical protein